MLLPVGGLCLQSLTQTSRLGHVVRMRARISPANPSLLHEPGTQLVAELLKG